MEDTSLSNYMFALPSFVSGAARLLDWSGQFDEYRTSETGAKADAAALASDWQAVGDDMRRAFAEFEAKQR